MSKNELYKTVELAIVAVVELLHVLGSAVKAEDAPTIVMKRKLESLFRAIIAMPCFIECSMMLVFIWGQLKLGQIMTSLFR